MEIINEKSGLSDDIEFHLFDIQPRPADSNVDISSKFSFQERMFAVCVLQMLECFDPKTKKVQFQQPFRGGLVKVLRISESSYWNISREESKDVPIL